MVWTSTILRNRDHSSTHYVEDAIWNSKSSSWWEEPERARPQVLAARERLAK
jgi:hypothetical protein